LTFETCELTHERAFISQQSNACEQLKRGTRHKRNIMATSVTSVSRQLEETRISSGVGGTGVPATGVLPAKGALSLSGALPVQGEVPLNTAFASTPIGSIFL
jgi:hypothetical protein